MSDFTEIKSLIERLPNTDAYGPARQVGSVFLQVLEEAEGLGGRRRWTLYADPAASVDDDRDLGAGWQKVGAVAKRLVTNIRVIPDC